MTYTYTCFDFENSVLLEWEEYSGDMDPYKIDVSPVKSYILFKDHCGNLIFINKVNGVCFSFSQRDTDGKYWVVGKDHPDNMIVAWREIIPPKEIER